MFVPACPGRSTRGIGLVRQPIFITDQNTRLIEAASLFKWVDKTMVMAEKSLFSGPQIFLTLIYATPKLVPNSQGTLKASKKAEIIA